jgi:hypothetical protein
MLNWSVIDRREMLWLSSYFDYLCTDVYQGPDKNKDRCGGEEVFFCLPASVRVMKKLKLRDLLFQGLSREKADLAVIQIEARAVYPYSENKT